jgi:hypothetical protein
MNILITVLLVLAALVVLLLIVGLFMKKEHFVKRQIVINAPLQQVFGFLRLLRNQDAFNTGAMAGADRKRDYKGTDGTVGFVYSWSGNKDAGEGEKEIISIVEGKRIEMEIRFVKPMATKARIVMETEAVSDTQTRVSWSNAGSLKYPVNIMIPMLERMLPGEMDKSLLNLKNILEGKEGMVQHTR